VPAYRYIVQGEVQGVGYRYFVLRQADALGIAGFARNRSDGSVEVVAEGGEQALLDLEGRLREGPAPARRPVFRLRRRRGRSRPGGGADAIGR